MVTVDDATYVKMRDTLYGGDAGKASRAKAQIEANYDDAKYNDFMNQLNGMQSQTSTSSSNNSGPADGYATATDRNMATAGAEFGRNNQTSNTPATPTTDNSNKGGETVVTSNNEIKQEGALKPLSQDYYNQTSQDAQDQIVKNLNDYKQSNPEYFTDYESFKRNFSYDARDDVQKNTLDQWYKGYQDGLTLSSTPTTDLYTQYKSGDLSDAQLQSLRVSDPTKYSELMSQINTGNIVAAYDDDKGMDITGNSIQEMAYQAAQQMFMQWMKGDTDNGASQFFREYEEKMESPEMKGLSDQCTEVQEQIENIQDDIASMKEEVEREYAGTGASRAKINAIIADRTYDLQLQLRTANSEYNKYATQYNNRMQQYQNEFQMGLQEYQINQQARQQQMQELGFAMDLMSFETPQQKEEREWNYWVKQQEYQNGNINSKDYQTRYKAALNSVQNLLSQYEGIPMQRSAEQMAQDVLKAIDNGSDLGAELTKINQQIQQKPEYKYLYNNTYSPASTGKNIQSYTIGDTEYVVYNGEMMTASDFNSKYGGKAVGSTGPAKAYNQIDNRAMNPNPMSIAGYDGPSLGTFLADAKNKKGNNGGWCGAFVNRYLKSIGVSEGYYDNDLSTKLNSVNTKIPTEGSIAVFDFGHITKETGQNHGHVAIVTKVYDDGSFDVIESNFNSDKKVGIRQHIDPTSNSVKGFFDPSQPPAGSNGGENKNQATSVDKLTLTALRNGQIVNSKVPETIDQLVKAGFSEDEISEALNQNMEYYLPDDQRAEKNAILNSFRGNEIVKNFQSATEQFLGLSAAVNEANGAGDLASIYMFMRSQDPRSVVRENEVEAAAQTMGLGGEVQTWFTKLTNGQRLTPAQRQNFIDVTVNVLESKKKAYKIVYDEAVNQMKAASIPSVYYPTDWATELDGIIAKLKGTTPQSTNQSTLQSANSSSFTPAWATKYETSTSYSSNNYVSVEGAYFPSTF